MKKMFLITLILFSFIQITFASQISYNKSDFAPVYTVIDDAAYDIRYYSSNNFTGKRINGYKAPVAYMTKEGLKSLSIAADDLRKQGQLYLDANCVPQVNYTLSANVEKVSDIGDTIKVIDERLGINILTHIISYDYDCILDKYTQIEFGNFTPTLSGLMSTITTETNKIVQENNSI